RLDRQCISIRAGKIERGYAHVISEVDPRARAKQQIDGCEVIVVNSPMKRRRTITLSCVDIDTRLEQGPDGCGVPGPDRLNQTKIVARCKTQRCHDEPSARDECFCSRIHSMSDSFPSSRGGEYSRSTSSSQFQ